MNPPNGDTRRAAPEATPRPWAVQSAAQMLPGCMYDPAAFDVFLHARGTLDCLHLFPDTPLGRVRAAQVRFTQGRPADWENLAEDLWGACAPARGVRLLVLCAMRLYEQVIVADPEPRGCLPIDLEDSCLAHYAVGIAAAQLSRLALAQEHLRTALTLARALKLHHRSQSIEAEWHRVRGLMGLPDPDEMQRLLAQPMPDQRRQWVQRLRAMGLMSLGAYSEALAALGSPATDTAPDAGMREWLHAVLMLPPARDDGDEVFDPVEEWWVLAQGLRALARGERPDVRGVDAEPMAGYARLISAEYLLQAPRMAGAAQALLGDEPPAPADQAAIWATMRIGAALENAQGADLLHAHAVLERELPRLRSSSEMMRIIRRINPERTVILALSPLGHLLDRSGLADQALLLGQVVALGGTQVRLPGRTGRTVVLEAAQVADRDDLTRSERKRLNEALTGFGPVVNMGRVLRAYSVMRCAAERAGNDQRAAQWRTAAHRVREMLSPDVQSALPGLVRSAVS